MDKILKKYTTIPAHLYVRRNADKQLRNIIEEMQRPGYVLVARQMGKTNLLLNAKRELEDQTRLFVYVDLSNSFETAQECFRYIIDMIIEPNFEIFKSLTGKIQHIRSSIPSLPPHVEYTNSLRELFKVHKNNLIIILDEIDALTSVSYSDQIFAQIRSTYFSGRSNFPEFNMLTYVLSGVVDPTELIKDKNKSPFNIGEKIYLDDFNFKEHLEFIQLSKIEISEELSTEIYNWTNGNPRMTFDICSEIENCIIEHELVNSTDLNTIVKTLYLTNHDIAPIDHIRELVRKNGSIREAVLNIQKGKTEISDDTKKKLYLYGIIGSDFNTDAIKIKNKIILESLSIQWINSVELETKSLYELGCEQIDKYDFKEGISTLLQYIESTEKIPSSKKEFCYYKIGYAFHKLKDNAESNKYFLKQIVNIETSPNLHYRQKFYIGLNYILLGEKGEGFKYLENIIQNYHKETIYINSLINIAANFEINEKLDFTKEHFYLDKALSKLNEENDSLNELDIIKLKTVANYYKAVLFSYQNDIQNSDFYISEAKMDASVYHLPLLSYLEFFSNNNIDLLNEIVSTILDNKLTFDEDDTMIGFSEFHLILYFETLISVKKEEYIDLLFEYAFENLYKFKFKSELYLFFVKNTKRQEVVLYFINKILDLKEPIINEDILQVIYRSKLIILPTDESEWLSSFTNYRLYFTKKQNLLELDDLIAYSYAIKVFADLNQNNKALELLFEIEKRLLNLNEDLRSEVIIIYYWFSLIYSKLNEHSNACIYAKKALDEIDFMRKKSKNISLINEEGLKTIKEQLQTINNTIENKAPVLGKSKFTRNENVTVKYFDSNKVVKAKFKKVELDIQEGRCSII